MPSKKKQTFQTTLDLAGKTATGFRVPPDFVRALGPGKRVSVRSDNDSYPGWPDCDLSAIDPVGRVIWSGRRIK